LEAEYQRWGYMCADFAAYDRSREMEYSRTVDSGSKQVLQIESTSPASVTTVIQKSTTRRSCKGRGAHVTVYYFAKEHNGNASFCNNVNNPAAVGLAVNQTYFSKSYSKPLK
jgi:hypothetical protein